MRLFAAVELPEDAIEALSDWWLEATEYLKQSDWRPVPAHLWHLTLAFYGDVGADDADSLPEQLTACVENIQFIHLCTGGFGVFPKPLRPRVFWAGVEDIDGGKSLKHLAHCCRRAGHATVRKRTAREAAFRGHITMARARTYPKGLDAGMVQMIPPVPEIYWCADRLSLFQSILRPEGPQYRRLETFYF
ncbi:MAG: RNA 2',3'-cyclic phosphodiesterase [Mariprofundus sp.]|nr:RNA 2',3'-cyclic phosphodiesterase [Mariprofundus sp.]